MDLLKVIKGGGRGGGEKFNLRDRRRNVNGNSNKRLRKGDNSEKEEV